MKTIYTVKSQKVSIVIHGGGVGWLYTGWNNRGCEKSLLESTKYYKYTAINIITSVVSCNCGGKNPVVVNLWLLGGTTIYRGYKRHRVPGRGLRRGVGCGATVGFCNLYHRSCRKKRAGTRRRRSLELAEARQQERGRLLVEVEHDAILTKYGEWYIRLPIQGFNYVIVSNVSQNPLLGIKVSSIIGS